MEPGQSGKLLVVGILVVVAGLARAVWSGDERYSPWDWTWVLGRHSDSAARIAGALGVLVGAVLIWGAASAA